MTNESAVQQICGLFGYGPGTGYALHIRSILKQLNPPSGEFTVAELCDLLNDHNGGLTEVAIDYAGDWDLIGCGTVHHTGSGIDELRDKLKELAAPPKPPTITVELPLDTAQFCASMRDGVVADACRKALEAVTRPAPPPQTGTNWTRG